MITSSKMCHIVIPIEKEITMFAIPNAVMNQYDAVLRTRAVPISQRSDYKKWLRFFYDFCAKYPVPDSTSERVRLFSEKLRAKKQTEVQCEMAAHAISLYFEIQKQEINMQESAEMAVRQQSTPILVASSQRALYQLCLLYTSDAADE